MKDETPQNTPEDTVGRLVHAAGWRPELRPADFAEIQRAARVAWTAKVEERRTRSRRRNVWLMAAAALVVAALGAYRVAFPPASPPPVAIVVAWFGAPPPPDGTPAAGEGLAAGAELSTDGRRRAALQLTGGASLRLDHDTRVILVSAGVLALEGGTVYLDTGAVYLDTGGTAGAAVEVRTPFGVARDVGTQFSVERLASGLAVRVREGEVLLELDSGDVDVPAGNAVEVTGGTVERREISPSGPEWRWVGEAAPPFELRGATLRAYLDWVARETGWRLRFADPELEAEATEIVTRGSLTGLEPAETLDLVLPGADLAWRLDGDVLVVERP